MVVCTRFSFAWRRGKRYSLFTAIWQRLALWRGRGGPTELLSAEDIPLISAATHSILHYTQTTLNVHCACGISVVQFILLVRTLFLHVFSCLFCNIWFKFSKGQFALVFKSFISINFIYINWSFYWRLHDRLMRFPVGPYV